MLFRSNNTTIGSNLDATLPNSNYLHRAMNMENTPTKYDINTGRLSLPDGWEGVRLRLHQSIETKFVRDLEKQYFHLQYESLVTGEKFYLAELGGNNGRI